jgi:hypothetical protein
MAPEQRKGSPDPIDHRADLWALGATMRTLLTGRYVDATSRATLGASAELVSLASIAPQLDPELVRVIDVALQFDQSRRWADARGMQRALRGCSSTLVLELPPPSTDSDCPDGAGSRTLSQPSQARGTERSAGAGKHRSRLQRALSICLAIGVLVGIVLLPLKRHQSVSAAGSLRRPRGLDVPSATSKPPTAPPVAPPLPLSIGVADASAHEPRHRSLRRLRVDRKPEATNAPSLSLTSDEILDQRR